MKVVETGKEEEPRQDDMDSHNHVERCGNDFARTPGYGVDIDDNVKGMERRPANQECRIDAKYCADNMSFPSVSRRRTF